MKIKKLLLPLTVVFGLVLAACGTSGANNGTGTPVISGTMPGESGTMIGTAEGTPMPGGTMEGTTTMMPVETGTSKSMGTGTPEGTAVLPPTGNVDPGRVSNELQFDIYSQDGQQVGTVNDLILDFASSSVSYVVVDTSSGTIPVPWDELSVSTSPMMPGGTDTALGTATETSMGAGTVGENPDFFVLKVDQSTFDAAPTIDLSTLPAIGESATGWDSQYTDYWNGQMGSTGMGTETSVPGTSTTTEATMGTTETMVPGATTSSTGTSMGVSLQGVALATKLMSSNGCGRQQHCHH